MNRRSFLLSAAAAACGSAQSTGRPPNFIVIFADDLGYGDLGCYGGRTPTPHLDRMAADGARFTDFYVPMPFCAPSRSSLLTGRYPFRTTVTGNPAPDAGLNDIGLPASEITIAEALKPLGYATACIGKWHLGHVARFLPRTQGFDEYRGILYSNDMRPVQVVHNETVAQYPVIQANLTRDDTQHAVDFIERSRRRPFFLYLPHAMPHKPIAASEEFYTPETPDDLYADVLRELDWSVGRILQAVKERGLDDNTLVLFSSDNGPWFGGSTAGLRGMKGSTFDGGIRVPFIARWPGRIPAGVVQTNIAASVDVFPTLCKAAGAKLPGDRIIDGRDILPMMQSASAASPHEAVFAMQGASLAVVRSGKWKLHVLRPNHGQGEKPMSPEQAAQWVDPRGPDGVTIVAPPEQMRPHMFPGLRSGDAPRPMMLFDMEADPAEQRDVAEANPDVVSRLKKLFDDTNAHVPRTRPVSSSGPRRLRRLTGGSLDYNREPAAGIPAVTR
jgi:arylsulfatase A-like enzyme